MAVVGWVRDFGLVLAGGGEREGGEVSGGGFEMDGADYGFNEDGGGAFVGDAGHFEIEGHVGVFRMRATAVRRRWSLFEIGWLVRLDITTVAKGVLTSKLQSLACQEAWDRPSLP